MDLLTFGAGIGLPAPFKVVYDAASKSLKGVPESAEGGETRPLCCKLVSADGKLKAFFTAEDRELCGFACDCGDLCALPASELSEPCAPDGFIKIRECGSLLAPDISYVIFRKINIFYDAAKKLIAVGSVNGEDQTYRICENMYVSVGSDCSPTGFLIKI